MNFSYIYFLEIVVSRTDWSKLFVKGGFAGSTASKLVETKRLDHALSKDRLVDLAPHWLDSLAEWHDTLLSDLSPSNLRNELLKLLESDMLLDFLDVLLLLQLLELVEKSNNNLLVLNEPRALDQELSNHSVLLLLDEQWDQLLEILVYSHESLLAQTDLLAKDTLLADELRELLSDQVLVDVADTGDWVAADVLVDG